MNFAGKNRKRNTSINVTPLIDVVFLLLIFVLLAAKFEPDPGIKVNAPEGKTSDETQPDVYVLSITKDGKMFFQKDPVTEETLPKHIKKMRETKKDPILAINADEEVPFKYVSKAMDISRQNGQTKFFSKLRGGN